MTITAERRAMSARMRAAMHPAMRNPFPGLRPFRTDEEHLFFGREQQVDRMIDKLSPHRFLAVVGTSGSGKSSLVNCGLRPALHRGYMAGAGSAWRMAQFRPGSDPIGALAAALAAPGVLFDTWEDSSLTAHELVDTTLRLGSLGLVDIVEQARLPERVQVLVVVDQFEELFRFHSNRGRDGHSAHGPQQEAIAFVKLLLEARAQTVVPIHVVLTMRSDFLGECAQFLGLAEAINDGQYLVPRLTREEIRAAISGPVGVRGATLSPLLVTRLLNDVGDNPDQLSILQHALNRTWYEWEHNGKAEGALDLPHYEAVGGMADALNRHAQRAFHELGTDERKRIATRAFKTLTDRGTDARGIRRPTPLKQLAAICGTTESELASVMEVFRRPSRSFLMPPIDEALTPDSWIDISHESLMRVWKTLAEWSEAEAQSARMYRRVSETAVLFFDPEETKASLWREAELRAALRWRADSHPNEAWAALYEGDFAKTMAFLDQSRDREVIEQREAEIERRWRESGVFVPIAVSFGMFIFLQIGADIWFAEFLVGLVSHSTDTTRWMAQILAHLTAGVPAAAGFMLLGPFMKKRFRQRFMSRIGDRARRAAGTDLALDTATSAVPTALEVYNTEYAGFGRRSGAHVIDWLATGTLWLGPIVAMAYLVVGNMNLQELYVPLLLLTPLWFVIGPWLYHARTLSSKHMATPGMRVAGLFATDLQGRPLSFARATGRHFAGYLSYYTLTIGYLMQPFNDRHQTLHDLISRTVVLRRPGHGATGLFHQRGAGNESPTPTVAKP